MINKNYDLTPKHQITAYKAREITGRDLPVLYSTLWGDRGGDSLLQGCL